MLWGAYLPAINVRTVSMVGVGFEPSALTFEVIRFKGDKTSCQVLIDLHNTFQCEKDMLWTVHVDFDIATVIKCNSLRQLEHRLNIASNPVGHVLPAHAGVTK